MYIPFYVLRNEKISISISLFREHMEKRKMVTKNISDFHKDLNFHEYDISTLFISFPFDCTQARNVEADHP